MSLYSTLTGTNLFSLFHINFSSLPLINFPSLSCSLLKCLFFRSILINCTALALSLVIVVTVSTLNEKKNCVVTRWCKRLRSEFEGVGLKNHKFLTQNAISNSTSMLEVAFSSRSSISSLSPYFFACVNLWIDNDLKKRNCKKKKASWEKI